MKIFSLATGLLFGSYLIADLVVFHGPLHRWSQPNREPLAARVAGYPITHRQLERSLREQLWLEGKTIESLSSQGLKMAREAALDALIDHELLRLQIQAEKQQVPVTNEEINERQRRLIGRFESKGALETAMKTQGIPSEAKLRARLAAQIRQEKFIQLRTDPQSQVSAEEARQWFDKNPTALAQPERVEARHIFIPTLNTPSDEAKKKLEAALAVLTLKQKDFSTLAKELSQDPANQNSGGQLGWMTRERLPVDFSAPLFLLKIHQPTLIRTRIGWHLVEVTARHAAEAPNFERSQAEIIAALETIKRRQAVDGFRRSLRRDFSESIEKFSLSETPQNN